MSTILRTVITRMNQEMPPNQLLFIGLRNPEKTNSKHQNAASNINHPILLVWR
jgi:hypothetical protein